ncbi:MAG: hypothetical protein K2M06_00425 [Muribaculaceae bacterium]|nr:hypothetical protein [Muribaculaceae bacterium]
MKIIADSSNTRTEWVLVEGTEVVERAFTTSLNPFFLSRREISHCIRLELPEAFFKRRWEHVWFYGAGCSAQDKVKTMEQSLVAQFKTPATVNSDLLGAARGLLVRESGLACILGTGSNSCRYDGTEIVQNVPPLGYILGDEGSASALGKKLIADVLKGIAPHVLAEDFLEHYSVTPNKLMDDVYSSPLPARSLAKYASFLATQIELPYAYNLVYDGFMDFFRRNIAFYECASQPVSFVGSMCTTYRSILEKAAADFGVTVEKVLASSMDGLIQFHATE